MFKGKPSPTRSAAASSPSSTPTRTRTGCQISLCSPESINCVVVGKTKEAFLSTQSNYPTSGGARSAFSRQLHIYASHRSLTRNSAWPSLLHMQLAPGQSGPGCRGLTHVACVIGPSREASIASAMRGVVSGG
jgi:hypothetical protein